MFKKAREVIKDSQKEIDRNRKNDEVGRKRQQNRKGEGK